MSRLLSFFLIISSAVPVSAQNDIREYLKTHHYSFSPITGFDGPTTNVLKQKFSNYKLILQGEGGSHFLNVYKTLPSLWIKFLNTHFGLTHFFMEAGHSSDILLNKYLETGDESYLYVNDKTFWRAIYGHNSTLPANNKLKYFGIDFESRLTYVQAMKSILPGTMPPQVIRSFIDLIKNANDSAKDCGYILSLNSKLKKALPGFRKEFAEFYKDQFIDFEKMVMNKGNCNDVYRNRNKNMYLNFLSFTREFNKPIYYGELGEAHTILKTKNTAYLINNSEEFKDKVCVINLYCHNCKTSIEDVSNWPLKNIEKDIQEYFLPYCNSDFTIFDVSDKTEITEKYRAYGQFLIIAKNQD